MGTTLTQRDWNTQPYTLMDKQDDTRTHTRSAVHTNTATDMNEHRQTHK